MKVIIYGSDDNTKLLEERVKSCLEEVGLTDFITLEKSQDEAIKTELSITKEPALVIEEEAIDFKDMIFEGMVPEADEIQSMFVSIIGWGQWGWCGSKEDDGSCGTGCAC